MKNTERDASMARRIAREVFARSHGRTYYVGGYVRDELLGRENKDIDIEIHDIEPEKLRAILDEMGDVQTQGASFGVYNIRGYDIDIAQPRKETATGTGHKDFEVFVDPFIGTTAAAKRRDFTMNAMMKDVLTGEIIDPFNGMVDIQNKTIRHVDDKTFKEDPLRVLRAAQFAARFGFEIAPETKQIMSEMDLSALSKERVYTEMEKALIKSDRPSVFFETLREVNQLDYWFPEVKVLIGCEQNPAYHPEGDAWNHTMRVLDTAATVRDQSSNPKFFMMSALCHDLGKPSTTTVKNGVIHNYGHDAAGVPVTRSFLSRINNNVGLRNYASNMVEMHMKLHFITDTTPAKSTNKLFDRSVVPRDLCLLTFADAASKEGSFAEASKNLAFWQERCGVYEKRMEEPQVTGSDLISLGLTPGEEFRGILSDAHTQHLSFVDKETVLKGISTKMSKRHERRMADAEKLMPTGDGDMGDDTQLGS